MTATSAAPRSSRISSALFDFATVQVGWMRFEGERPTCGWSPIGDPMPDRPGEDYKQGIKMVVMLPGGLGAARDRHHRQRRARRARKTA